jgi:hypothetical protein
MQCDPNLKVLMNYNFELSAKESGKVLAIEAGKLKEIDLKTASLCTKIKLWWYGSLNLEKIGTLARANEAKWSQELSHDTFQQVQLEKKCAWLSRKIAHSHAVSAPFKSQYRSSFEWLLTGKIHYPTGDKADSPLAEKEVQYRFDRLSTMDRLHQRLSFETGKLTVLARSFSAQLAPLFETHAYAGDYLGDATPNRFLKDTEAGQNRTFTVTFKNVKEKELGDQFFTFCYYEHLRALQEANRGLIKIPTSVKF